MPEDDEAKRTEEIEHVRRSEQRPAAELQAAEKRREIEKLTKDLIRFKKAKNLRAYGEALRQAGIREPSAEWKNAWAFYYDRY
jgi:cell fate (sporulation/competence/biofilm development) regulator YmcA (YheA/YmcA/DUF963 family)